MKIKTFNKKLALNKTTVTNLNPAQMIGVNGGATVLCEKSQWCPPTGFFLCPTYISACCPASVIC